MSRVFLGRSSLNHTCTKMENVTALSQAEWHINNCREFNKDLVQPLYHVAAPLPASVRAGIEQQSWIFSHVFVQFNVLGTQQRNANQKEISALVPFAPYQSCLKRPLKIIFWTSDSAKLWFFMILNCNCFLFWWQFCQNSKDWISLALLFLTVNDNQTPGVLLGFLLSDGVNTGLGQRQQLLGESNGECLFLTDLTVQCKQVVSSLGFSFSTPVKSWSCFQDASTISDDSLKEEAQCICPVHMYREEDLESSFSQPAKETNCVIKALPCTLMTKDLNLPSTTELAVPRVNQRV